MSTEKDQVHIPKTAFQEWLEKLQQESWQLELLISGFALFAIWEARMLVDGFEEYSFLQRGASRVANMLFSNTSWFLTIAWRIFFFNLLIHVFSRGLWIGAIGLRYVSSEINYEYFDYAPVFENFLRRRVGEFDDYIEKLERFSSVIFAYTFLLLFIFLSLVLYFAELGLIATLLDENSGALEVSLMIFLALGIFAFIDFISMGGIKTIKQKYVAKVYYVFYRIFSILTLSFLYRPLLYNFWDEKYTRRLFLVSIPYILLLSLLPKVESEAFPFFPIFHHGHINDTTSEVFSYRSRYYDDEREQVYQQSKGLFKTKQQIKGISLPSIELSGNYSWFFLRIYPDDAQWLAKEKEIIPYKKAGMNIRHTWDLEKDSMLTGLSKAKFSERAAIIKQRQALTKSIKKEEINQLEIGVIKEGNSFQLDSLFWKEKLDSINVAWDQKLEDYKTKKVKKLRSGMLDLTTITIDSIPYTDKCDCKFYIHPNIGERGLRCYFPMAALEEGEHLLHLKRKDYDRGKNDYSNTLEYHVPFYKINKDH